MKTARKTSLFLSLILMSGLCSQPIMAVDTKTVESLNISERIESASLGLASLGIAGLSFLNAYCPWNDNARILFGAMATVFGVNGLLSLGKIFSKRSEFFDKHSKVSKCLLGSLLGIGASVYLISDSIDLRLLTLDNFHKLSLVSWLAIETSLASLGFSTAAKNLYDLFKKSPETTEEPKSA